jgi:hypothetical protein
MSDLIHHRDERTDHEFHPPELANKLPTIIGPRRIAHVTIDMAALPKQWPAEVALADS